VSNKLYEVSVPFKGKVKGTLVFPVEAPDSDKAKQALFMEAKQDVRKFVACVLDVLAQASLAVSDLEITEDFTKKPPDLVSWEVREIEEKVND
jgi:hypothetical protein